MAVLVTVLGPSCASQDCRINGIGHFLPVVTELDCSVHESSAGMFLDWRVLKEMKDSLA